MAKKTFLQRLFAADEPAPRKRKKLTGDIIKDPQYRVSLAMDVLRSAFDQAIDVYNPNRNELLLLYYWVARDGHVLSQHVIANNKIAGLPFRVWQGNVENEDLKYIFKRPWFDDYIKLFVEAELWGPTLGEFGDIVNGEFTSVKAFPRRWVNSARREILTSPSALRGAYYGDMLNDLYMIEFGDNSDQGTLEIIAREVIWKNFARTDWSDFNERFGKPIIDIATDTDDDEEVRKRAEMASNFGGNGWLVRDIDDEVNILEAKNIGGNGANFERKIRMCNEEISKIINGQSGTSDEKSFVGSAEVGERILNDYTKARVRRMSNHINYVLIPFMIYHGYKLQDCTFEFIIEEKQSQQNATDPESGQPVNKLLKKKSPGELRVKAAQFNFDNWLRRFFEGRVLGVDASVWQLTFDRLIDAMSAAGISFAVEYEYAELATALRSNAAVFAAFKNHSEQSELAKLLVDQDGKPVDWNTFKKAAKPLTEQYNKEWLQTEFKQAQAQAQMAVKWEGFRQSKDLYPNLRYEAVGDSATRPEHARLNGTVRPIDDPFWSRNYPPNGWGCRCSVVQTDEKPTRSIREIIADPGFDHNSGKDRKLFAPSNAYQANTSDADAANVEAQAQLLLNEYLRG